MIQVGLHSNLVINKVEVSKEQTGNALNVQFKQAGEVSGSLLDILNSSSDMSSSGNTQNFKLFRLNSAKSDGTSLSVEDIVKNINERKVLLSHILQSYMTKDKIKFDLFKNTQVKTVDDFTKLQTQDVLDTVVDNMNAQFIDMIKSHVKDDGKKLYVKFIRTSKDKNFPKLPTRYLESQPFMAPMDDADAKSKVKFSKYEIEQGLNSAERVLGEADATPDQLAEQTNQINALFS